MPTCPNKNLQSWKDLVNAQGEKIAYYLWDKYGGSVPDRYMKSLNEELVDGFLKDFGITATEYDDFKNDVGIDAYAAADLVAKSIAYQKGQSIAPEVAYFAYQMLGKQNSKIRSNLRYFIYSWDKFRERFNHHKNVIQQKEGFIPDSEKWKRKIRDLVILDFLKENIESYYLNPKEFKKSMDTKWVGKDFKENMNLFERFMAFIEDLLSKFSNKHKAKAQKLEDLGLAIADEILNKNYEYFKYNLSQGQFQKYFKDTIESDPFAKEIVEFGQDIGLILTGSLALRRAGTIYRTADETLHDIDWVIPYDTNFIDENKEVFRKIKNAQGPDKMASANLSKEYVPEFSWYKKMKEKYPSMTLINSFYDKDGDYESLTAQAVVGGEFYLEDGVHQEEKFYYVREDGRPVKKKKIVQRSHRAGDHIADTGYVIDFFIRLKPGQDEHENYFKLWKEIMIAKLKMGRDKDFIDWKAFTPFLKSRDSFNFNFEGYRHINYEDSQNNAFDDFQPEVKEEVVVEPETNIMLSKEDERLRVIEKFNLKPVIRAGVRGFTTKNDKITKSFVDSLINWVKENPIYSNILVDWDMIHNLIIFRDRETKRIFSLEGMQQSKASAETIEMIKQAAKNMGIDIQELTDYAKKNPDIDVSNVNGVADLIKGVVAVAEGREDIALTEEIVHIATAIVGQVNPKMVTEMISKIDRFKIYKQTLELYKNDKNYQLPNGKPDIRKIKKEAVDKLISELIVKQSEGSTEFPELMEETNRSFLRNLWNKILDFIRGIYRAANIDVFSEAASMIARGEVGGTAQNVNLSGDIFKQKTTDAQQSVLDSLKATADSITKIESNEKVDPILLDTDEASSWYDLALPSGSVRRVGKRVTDRVKAWYKKKFPNKKFTEEEKKFNELKRNIGIDLHGTLQDIHGRFYNSDGTKRTKAEKRPVINDSVMDAAYDKVEEYYLDLIKQFPKDTLILAEQIVYDPQEDEAGTIDFLAIEPSGKTHILDWKFMYINPNMDDVAWFKQAAYDIQLGRYKQILKEVNGVKEFGMTRAIPFLMEFKLKNRFDPSLGYKLGGIVAGSADATKIEDLRLMPVPEKTESTGEAELDNLIVKLNSLLEKIANEDVSEEEREFKRERLNVLRQTIRIIQATSNIAPLIDTIEVMRKEGDRILNEYETIYKDMPASSRDADNKQLSDFSNDMNNYLVLSSVFTNIGSDIGDLIYDEAMDGLAKTKAQKEELKERKDASKKLDDESKKIYQSSKKIREVSRKFADKHIGQRNVVTGLLDPKRVVRGLTSFFDGIADIPLPSVEILFKLSKDALGRASESALEKVNKIIELREKIMKRGDDPRAMLSKLYQKEKQGDKEVKTNKLIYQFSSDFRTEVDNKYMQGGDRKWLLDNIDVPAYMEEAKKVINNRLDQIKRQSLPGTKEQVAAKKKQLSEQVIRQYDITRKDFDGGNNYIIKRHPLPKWYSEEYKEIEKDEDLRELYKFISEFNEVATEAGYIENNITKTFLPFVRKTMAEGLAWDNVISAIGKFGDSLSIDPNQPGANIDAITGEVQNSIPRYFTYDFTRKEDGVNDYSDVSDDLFKNLIIYVQHVYKYKYLTEVEGQIKLVKTIEEFKDHLSTDKIGNVISDENGNPIVEKGNKDNLKLLDDFMKVVLYDQKYVLTPTDTVVRVGEIFNFVKGAINKVAGREVYKINENVTALSLINTIDAANRGFQVKTLGLEAIPGIVNLFGANVQMSAQAGAYFNYGEFGKNQKKVMSLEFSNDEEKSAFIELMNTFMPLKDDPSSRLYKKAGISKWTNANIGDMLMITMSYPEEVVEKSIFITLLENTFVKDGKIVSIKKYVNDKYKDRYKSGTRFKELESTMKQEIEELKKQSLWATKKMVDGKLEIPGLDLKNREEIQRLTNLTRRISRNITGGMSDGNISKAQMNIWTKSAMVFKGWIPKLWGTRFSELKRVTDDFNVVVDEKGMAEGQRFEIGRMRLLADVFMRSFKDRATSLSEIIRATDGGIEALDRMYIDYAKKYKQRTGERFTMSREDFMDMVRENLRNQIRELQLLAALMGSLIAMKFVAPDDDDDKAAKNFYRFSLKTMDKFVSELSFFYNPLEFEQILSGNMFPAIGLVNDQLKFMSHFWMETTGVDFSDPTKSPEEIREKARPIKYAMKAAPVFKSALTYGAILSDDFAKEFDITIQKESRR